MSHLHSNQLYSEGRKYTFYIQAAVLVGCKDSQLFFIPLILEAVNQNTSVGSRHGLQCKASSATFGVAELAFKNVSNC